MYKGPGIYWHYKGGHYRVLGIAEHESTGQKVVIYHSYSPEYDLNRMREGIDFVARPLDDVDGPDAFNTLIRLHGNAPAPRFIKLA